MISNPTESERPANDALALHAAVPGGAAAPCRPEPGVLALAPARGENEIAVSVLLVAPEPPAAAVAQALRRELEVRVHIAPYGRSALTALRREDFQLIVLEENLAAAEPDAAAALFAGAGTAPVLEMNFGLCGVDRILRQVRSALQRRAEDEAKARKAVAHSLQNELNASLAGLLLESQLALRGAGPEILPTLQHLIQLASALREQLRG